MTYQSLDNETQLFNNRNDCFGSFEVFYLISKSTFSLFSFSVLFSTQKKTLERPIGNKWRHLQPT